MITLFASEDAPHHGMRLSVLGALALITAAALPVAAQTPLPRPAGEFAITMNDGSQKLLSSYKGKVVCMAFFFTTCPHCQDMAKLLSQIQPEYGPKGVQILAAAFNPEAKEQTPDFVSKYVKNFPMGSAERGQVLEFLQQSIMAPLYVPVMVFIDRKGTIESMYIGDQKFLADPPKNVRAELDKLLAKPIAKPAAKPVTHLSKK